MHFNVRVIWESVMYNAGIEASRLAGTPLTQWGHKRKIVQ